TFMPHKPDLVFPDAPTVYETVPIVFHKAPSFVQSTKHVKTPRPSVKPVKHPIPAKNLRKDFLKSRGHRHSWNRKSCFVCKSLTHLIKDCDYYEKKMVQKPVKNHAMRGNHQYYAKMTYPYPYRHVVPTTVLTRSRLVPLTATRPVTTVVPQTKVQHQRPTKHGVNAVQGVKGNWGNPQHALKDKGVIDSGCSRHMIGNISYLFDFEEINGGYVAFGGIPKSDTKCLVLSSDFKLPDDYHNRVLVTKPHNKTPYELLLGRTPSIGFMRSFGCPMTILNTIYPLDPQNTDANATFEVKEPESAVHVSPSSCEKTKKHDDKTKSKAKGKSHVELSTGVRNLSEEFEDFSDNSINGVNAASTPVTVVGQNSTNNTNTFSAAGPSNIVVSPTLRKYSYVDPSQYPDDPNMPALEDITYSDDKEDVGAEADFSNLETNKIPVLFQQLESIKIILLHKSLVIYLQLLKPGV
nr:ribonuclease H-like domain-containing protein [Tanacetum cinerariifolium]